VHEVIWAVGTEQADAWTSANWIALAGIVAALVGVWLGSHLTSRLAQHNRLRQDIDLALVKTDMALGAMRIDDLSAAEMLDRSVGLDHSRTRLESLQRGESITLARDSLAVLRVRHPSKVVKGLANQLDADLSQVHAYTVSWYELLQANRDRTNELAKKNLDVALDSASKAYEMARVRWLDLHAATREKRWWHRQDDLTK
jgi:hypothetical protein